MNKKSFFGSSKLVLVAVLALGGCGGSTGSGGTNLLVNGNADSATGSSDGTPVTTPGWTITGEATAIQYGTSEYPQASDPGPADRGANFFTGGQSDMVSTMSQTVDVSRFATAIDAGHATFVLSGWLGGFSDQDDAVVVTVAFQGASGAPVGTGGTIGPVLAADRGSVTALVQRSTNGPVPTGTRTAVVVVTMTRVSGAANDGYCDDLSLVLDGV